MAADPATLAEKREQFHAKQDQLKEIFDLARDGSVYDFGRKAVLEKLGASDSADAVQKVKARNVELDELGSALQQAEMKSVETAVARRAQDMTTPAHGGPQHPTGDLFEHKSFGQLFTESKAYQEGWKKHQQRGIPAEIDIGLKVLFETTAGFAPESIRSGRVVPAATRPIQVLDLIPTSPINQPVEKYMEETTATFNALEKGEGVAYAEATFVYTERTSDVRKITASIPVTDEQLDDELQVRGLLEQRLRFGIMQRLDAQVLTGDGVAPNLRGLLDAGLGIQTQAKGADPTFDAVYKAITLVRFTGRAQPNALIFHPNDWQDIRLARTADGLYLMGNPSEPGPLSLFGLPVALSDACTENTGIVGDFANFSHIGERRGVNVQIGYSGTQFAEGKSLLRADVRACLTWYRPTAFASITGI